MNLSKKIPQLIVILLIALSLFGVFEERALHFVSEVYKKNGHFLALTTEVKLAMAGLSSIKVPFVAGIANDINNKIGNIQEYLLLTSIISFLQVLLISISKSWILKLFTVTLFIFTFFKKTKKTSSKLLLLFLALNPGLILYSVGVEQISKEASIDYGSKYLVKLKASVEKVKIEKADLMKQHAEHITKINNGQKGIHILEKFRENVSYDFKRAKIGIKGAHANMRLLIREGGYEMTNKIFGFCSMILFSMLLMPLGYVLIIYTLFNSLFKTNSIQLADSTIGNVVQQINPKKTSNFKGKINTIFRTYLEEFHAIPKSGESSNSIQKSKNSQ